MNRPHPALHLLLAVLAALALALSPAAFAAPRGDEHGAEAPATAGEAHATGDEHAAADAHGSDEAHGGEAHHAPTPDWVALGWHAFNLTLFLAIIVYYARQPLGDELRRREHDVKKELTDAARERDEARQRHDELGTRISRFEEELQGMLAAARQEAAHEEERLIERAKAEAARIEQTAQRGIRDEVIRAQVALRRDAVDLAVQLATTTLENKVQSDDQRRLARQFLDSLKSDGVGNG